MSPFDPDDIRKASTTARWSALTRLGRVSADLQHFDRFLVRTPRLLVPVDVQALVVRAGVNDAEPMVTLPFRSGDPDDVLPPVDVTDAGTPRPPGVHLLWSVPAALGLGSVVPDPAAQDDPTRRRLRLPTLPDRWVVLRLAVPVGAEEPLVTGWVVQADTATVTPLSRWPDGRAGTVVGTPVPADRLDVQVGGASWLQSYDAATGRCALHDPLDDLAGTAVEGDTVTYLVAGWWTDTDHDPLHDVGTDAAYRQRLAALGWQDPDHPTSDADRRHAAEARTLTARVFGLPGAGSFDQPVAADGGKAADDRIISGIIAPETVRLSPAVSGFASAARAAALLPPAPTSATLLTGRLHGVPLVAGLVPDSRPDPAATRTVLGATITDLVATTAATGTAFGGVDAAPAHRSARRDAERLLAAFSAGAVMRLGDADVWSDVEQWEHGHGFGALPGGTEGTDRFVDRPRAGRDPGAGGRPGVVRTPRAAEALAEATVLWNATRRPEATFRASTTPATAERLAAIGRGVRPRFDGVGAAPQAEGTVRTVDRPAPRWSFPAPAVLAIAGGGRTMSAVERDEADGLLTCRLSDQVSRGHAGVVSGRDLLTTLGTAAVPDEVLDLAREALAEDPHLAGWRTDRAAATSSRLLPTEAVALRLRAESTLSYAYYGGDDGLLSTVLGTEVSSPATRQRATEGLLRASLSEGVWAHPEGVTLWGQPWRPLFCDWSVELDLGGLTGWHLDGVDLDPADAAVPPATDRTVQLTGRSPLVTGVATSLAAAVDRWLADERQRDAGGHGLADPATEQSLATLRDTLSRLDLLSVSLSGVREHLLGLAYDRGLQYRPGDELADGTRRALAVALPTLVTAGRLRVTAARLVDAFGRTLALPVDDVVVAARLADDDDARVLRLRPRISAPARWRFDLVDATSTAPDAALAGIDQADRARQVTPVAGFLLPDHLDESLEVFGADGRPLGELLHDPFSDAVSWEIAPGRTDVAPAAGPTDDPDPTHHRVGWIAAGLVAADATSRQGRVTRPEEESPLSALLRAVDTTLWTVDPFGALGQSHIAGLVGRPIAVVAARLSLDVHSDVEERAYADGVSAADRVERYAALAAEAFTVKLGDVTRADDGLLGYFVDDDYTRLHVVDRVIATSALPSGRLRGPLDRTPGVDPTLPTPLASPGYVDDHGELTIRPGQTIRLTLLMHPGGKVHLTSGVLPVVSHGLARDWVDPGLSVLAPSLRTGPLLVDADKVRLPKVASFPAEQLFTRRDTPTTWKDDPILAATQSALLPDVAPQLQEGWIRVSPTPTPEPGGGS